MNESELRSFLLVRGLLDRAVAASDGTDPGAMTSVILFDLAVETAAKTTAAAHPPKAFDGRGYLLTAEQRRNEETRRIDPSLRYVLDQLLASAREKASDDRLRVREIRETAKLHDLRNRVQHDAEVPAAASFETAQVQAVSFISWATETFFEEDFSKLSRASLVRNDSVREQLEMAEAHASRGQLEFAAQSVSVALEFARLEFQIGQPWHERQQPFRHTSVSNAMSDIRRGSVYDSYAASREYRRLEELLKTLTASVVLVMDRVEAITLGAQASEYVWFRRHFPGVVRVPRAGGTTSVSPMPLPGGMTQATFERGRDFVISAALHWQQFPAPPTTDEPEAP